MGRAQVRFVTIASLGSGHIKPLGPARMFGPLEGMLDQFYIAVLIARVVSFTRRTGPRGEICKDEFHSKKAGGLPSSKLRLEQMKAVQREVSERFR
jgi:hypothetical protein